MFPIGMEGRHLLHGDEPTAVAGGEDLLRVGN